MEVVPGSTVGHTAYNGVTRQIPGTQNLHAPIPSIEEEPRWMRLSVTAPVVRLPLLPFLLPLRLG